MSLQFSRIHFNEDTGAQSNWRVPGVSGKDVFYAIGTAVGLFSFSIVFNPIFTDHAQIFPWYRPGLASAYLRDFEVRSSLYICQRPSSAPLRLSIIWPGRFLLLRNTEPKLSEGALAKSNSWNLRCFFILWDKRASCRLCSGSAVKNDRPYQRPPRRSRSQIHNGYVTPAKSSASTTGKCIG